MYSLQPVRVYLNTLHTVSPFNFVRQAHLKQTTLIYINRVILLLYIFYLISLWITRDFRSSMYTVKHPEPTDKTKVEKTGFSAARILESVRTFSAPGWSPGGTGCLAVSQQWSGRRVMLWRGWAVTSSSPASCSRFLWTLAPFRPLFILSPFIFSPLPPCATPVPSCRRPVTAKPSRRCLIGRL